MMLHNGSDVLLERTIVIFTTIGVNGGRDGFRDFNTLRK
jgi:hypothetical protein